MTSISQLAEKQWVLSNGLISAYPCDATMKEELSKIVLTSHGWLTVLKVATNVFAVYGPPRASAPLGFVHLWKVKDNLFRCTSQDCKSLKNTGLGKQRKNRKLCIHQHVLLCVLHPTQVASSSTPLCSTSPLNLSDSTSTSSLPPHSATVSTSSLVQSTTILANLSRSLPYPIPLGFINKAKQLDAATVIKLNEGCWPAVFQPEESHCRLCFGTLGNPKLHPGSRGGSYIMTNANPFLPCKINVKSCLNKDCKAMHQVWPVELGLFNIYDKILLSFEVLIEWRAAFKRGVPISSAIECKLEAWSQETEQDLQPSSSEINYLCRLLYNGFYCFEMISVRSLDDSICGLCGIIGEFYLGDGNEKNCCSLKGVKYDTDNKECSPLPLEDFLFKLKRMWITKASFSNFEGDVDINASEVPPIIAPAMRGLGKVVLNTEMKKKSIYLQSRKKSVTGDPALLHLAITSNELNMTSLESLDLLKLRELAQNCAITLPSGATKSFVITELHALYESLLVGNSPCHGFNRVVGNTGGFYHFVCRHGCTVASKFLLLQESVRDAADIYLSLRYPPSLFICDTPCGFARHMDVRDPQVAKNLWGDNVGCFEKPVLGKQPNQFSVPEIVPLEYRTTDVVLPKPEELKDWEHPITGNMSRFVVGDRFHTATEPHKSPLCEFHDLKYLEQAYTVKTSYQESENHRKNFLRLRSSTMQSFPVHFTYNYLMDFYHNEQIVCNQIKELKKRLQPNEVLSRDIYKRFVKIRK